MPHETKKEAISPEKDHENFVNNIADWMWEIDVEGIISFCSENVINFTGYSSEELKGTSFFTYMSEIESKRVKNEFDSFCKSKSFIKSFVIESETKDGKLAYFEMSAAPIFDSNDELVCYKGISIDTTKHHTNEVRLTKILQDFEWKNWELDHINEKLGAEVKERKLAEEANIKLIEELHESQKDLKESIDTKDKFFSIMAHDIKGPFTGFLGLSKILAHEFSSLTVKDIQEYADDLYNSASQLFKLLENLLQWSRIQRGMLELAPENFPLQNIVKMTIDLMANNAKAKNIELVNNVSTDHFIFADINSLQTIIRNLMANAVKFTPHDGTITINSEIYNKNVVVTVKDNGVGMSPDTIDKLFDPSHKVSTPGTDGEPSTGLGLVLCKDLVENNNGKIWVESELEVGSEFRFSLPSGG